jgi:NAD-dependent SIR2 family protein deacetylase
MKGIDDAAAAIRDADALLIGAGAGMGVDSGLPDFRGSEGFWRAYPAFRGKSFQDMADPSWFHRDPAQGWGFYGHRLHLYRDTQPHAGFQILRRWCQAKPSFVFTSNVDGHFQRAGFDEADVVECHGSIHFLQCLTPCRSRIWSANNLEMPVDEARFRATGELPECPDCGGLARPNILMFGDGCWVPNRRQEQGNRYINWCANQVDAGARVVAIEMGAGSAIPTVRFACERLAQTVIRINPRDCIVRPGDIALPMAALDALTSIDGVLTN